MSSETAGAAILNKAQQATDGLLTSAFDAASGTLSTSTGAQSDSGRVGVTGLAYGQVSVQETGVGLASFSNDPVLVVNDVTARSTPERAAWWRQDQSLGGIGMPMTLGALLSSIESSVGDGVIDPEAGQQQALLRQSMAAFGASSGGSTAIWGRDGVTMPLPMAASSVVQNKASASMVLTGT